MSLAERKSLAVALSGVAESRNIGPCCGLLAKVSLIDVVAVQMV